MKAVTLEEALIVYRKLSPIAYQFGYLISLYGSVIEKGIGRDLDILITPNPILGRCNYPEHCRNFIIAIAEKVGIDQTIFSAAIDNPKAIYKGVQNTYAICIMTNIGALDIQIREVVYNDQIDHYNLNKNDSNYHEITIRKCICRSLLI